MGNKTYQSCQDNMLNKRKSQYYCYLYITFDMTVITVEKDGWPSLLCHNVNIQGKEVQEEGVNEPIERT